SVRTLAVHAGGIWAVSHPVGRGRGPGQGARRSGPAGTGPDRDGHRTQGDGRPPRRHCSRPAGPRARGRARREHLTGEASLNLGQAYYASGGFGQAAELLRWSVEAAAREAGTPRTAVRISSQAWLARTLGTLGAFTEGRRHGEEALRLATLEGRGYLPAIAHAFLGLLYLTQGDLEHAIRLLEQSLALCRASGNRTMLRTIATNLGFASALQGRLVEGRALLEEGVSESIRTGGLRGLAHRVAWLSEVCRLEGR